MKKTIFALFSICVIAFSCKKSDPDPVAPVNKPYSNTTAGTSWVYETKVQDPTTLDTTTAFDTSRVISGDTSIGSKSYSRIEHNNGSHSYYNVTGGDYFQFQYIAALDTSIEALYLKDNGGVGTTWNQVVNVDIGLGIPIAFTLTYSITEVGGTKTLFGTTYNDVITVKTDIAGAGLPAGTIIANISNSYARNIGLVQGDYNIDVATAGLSIHSQTNLKYCDPQ